MTCRHAIVCAVGVLALLVSSAWALTLAWDAVTTYEDGTPITDLAGYVLYYRATSTEPWVFVGTTPTTIITVPTQVGEYTVVAVTTLGIESQPSNLISTKRPKHPVITNATR
jgi:hypothetical protein